MRAYLPSSCDSQTHSRPMVPQGRAGEPTRQRRRSRERPWTSSRVLLFMILSVGTMASALTYTVLHHNQRCLTRKQTAVAASGRGPKRRHWRRDNLAAELRLQQQCRSAFGGIASPQRVKLKTVAIVGALYQACQGGVPRGRFNAV